MKAQQVFVIIVSGEYTSDINGRKETAQRATIAGAYNTQEEADAVLAAGPTFGSAWGPCAAYVDTAVIGQAAQFE